MNVCANNHMSGRYESGQCIECHRERERVRYAADPSVREAKKAQSAAWKLANPERKRASDKKCRTAARDLLWRLKSVPCMDCRNAFPPYCMDFDHARGEKLFEIGRNAARVPADVLLTEIQKCDVVCANCHRVRTQRRLDQV